MTLPVYPNTLTLTQIQTEFSGANPVAISEYYAGGSYVPAGSVGYPRAVRTAIPSSGRISVGNFHGAGKVSPVNITYPSLVDMYGHGNGPWNFTNFLSPNSFGANATNLHFIFTASGGLPAVDSGVIYTWWVTRVTTNGKNYRHGIARPQDFSGSELTIPANLAQVGNIDFYITGDWNGAIDSYVINLSDGITSKTVTLNIGLYW